MKKQEYLYAIANDVTGMDLMRSVWAKNKVEAVAMVEKIAPCFGRSTVIIGVEAASTPELKLEGGHHVKDSSVVRHSSGRKGSVPKGVPSRRRAR